MLEKKLILLKEKGTTLIVFGSTKQRIYNGEEIHDLFTKIGDLCRSYNIVFCLENNSSLYGCNWMTTIQEVLQFVKIVNHPYVKANLDMGSMIMENEQYHFIQDDLAYIGHVQISFPNLGIWDKNYEPYIANILHYLKEYKYEGKISLEVKSESMPFQSVHSFMYFVNAV